MFPRLLSTVVLLLLGGCASVLSDRVLEQEPRVAFETVQADPERSVGKLVVVGGSILKIHETGGQSYLEVLEQPLDGSLRPVSGDVSAGRFLIRMAGKPDPAVWFEDRRVTLAGRVEGVQSRPLGRMTYRYPVLKIEEVHLWPETGRYYSSPRVGFSVGGGFSF